VRVVRRAVPGVEAEARELLTAAAIVAVDAGVVEAAMDEPDPMLRSLYAIHLARRARSRPTSTDWSPVTTGSPVQRDGPA